MATRTDDDGNAIDLLVRQHEEIEQVFRRLEGLTGAETAEVEGLAREAVIRLVQHSVSEEVHLYPTTRRMLDEGDDLAGPAVSAHDEAEQTMKRLEALGPEDPGFWPEVHQLIEQVRRHVQEEECELFPRLRQACTEEHLCALGEEIEQVQRTAPTRPHPASPSEGILLQAVAPGTGMVDRIRDAFSGRGRSRLTGMTVDEQRGWVLERLDEDELRAGRGELPLLDDAERLGRLRIMRTDDGRDLLLAPGPLETPAEREPVPFEEKAEYLRRELPAADDATVRALVDAYDPDYRFNEEWQF